MGLSVAISGGIILTVFMLILLSLPGFVDKMFSIGDITSQVARLEKSISDTEISMHHVSTLINEPTLNFTLRNDGQEKIWNFNDFDLFVTYDGTVSGRLTEDITYDGDCLGGLPPQGNWCIESITGDMLDPGILNSAEDANIIVLLNENLANVNAIVSISTDNGVTDTVLAPYCGPSCYQMIWDVLTEEGSWTWANIGLGGGGAEELDANNNHRAIIDLTDMSQWRMKVRVEGGANTTPACFVGVQYSLDGGTTWFALDNGIIDSMSTANNSCDNVGDFVTAWSSINATAQSDVELRIVGNDTPPANTADPTFGIIQMQFRS